ncbi:FAD-dependent oxidoreductase [Nocardia carnea]|uniref:FAD-dependent oxidoreductase n=1 Tax=Nocardia carnea TaxID=37328 RepID=UPI00245670A6|nr:NAD(P)/FAD-dependent oxidoreductase [Nocardia carnea]
MRKPVGVEDQYARAADDDMKILVVGAGIAGVTIAQLLRRDGRNPVLIERAAGEGHPGYMLALMPMVDAALDDLGVRQIYVDNSIPLGRYGFRSHTGRMLRRDSMAAVLDRFGDYRGIGRGELMDVLAADGCEVAYGTTVTALDDSPEQATVTFDTPAGNLRLAFDLVIVADGIHSATRELVLGDRGVDVVDTAWGGWVVWASPDVDGDMGEELWGAGFFLGVYPVLGQLGVFLGGPSEELKASPEVFVDSVRKRLKTISPRTDRVLRAVADDPAPFYWPLSDCRAPVWADGRTVLLGDAAAGFLPTAGIGAGMAMESAWVLARILRYAEPGNVERLLRHYESSQRPRVEAAQDTSRNLAGLMFRRSSMLAVLRDIAMRVLSIQVAIRPIQRLLRDRPDPDASAAAVAGRRAPRS